ncbi:MAG TPA: MotE family protein [Caulobacteraceae bacterium]|nr:MotE family protein [Caulobacteraceae bacterium]
MSRLPRILPLLAVAALGVLAIDALENGPGILGAARSFAEGAAAVKRPGPLPPGAGLGQPGAQAVGARPAPICAESAAELARNAGLSPAELQVLQSLGARRGELDQRAQGLDTQMALLEAAETKMDAKIATMNALKSDMQGLLGQLDAKQAAEIDRLVKVYETMKPADSAARFTLLADDVRLPIAAKMKARLLSAMLAKMAPEDAKRLTESLAARYLAQADAARQAINPPAPAPAAAAPPVKPARSAPPPRRRPAPRHPVRRRPVTRARPVVHPHASAPPKPAVAAAAPAAKPNKPL